jgi:hypothetical protein
MIHLDGKACKGKTLLRICSQHQQQRKKVLQPLNLESVNSQGLPSYEDVAGEDENRKPSCTNTSKFDLRWHLVTMNFDSLLKMSLSLCLGFTGSKPLGHKMEEYRRK